MNRFSLIQYEIFFYKKNYSMKTINTQSDGRWWMRTILLLLGLHVLFAFGYWLLITINKIEIFFRANQLIEKKFSIAYEIHTGLSVFESIYGTKEIANVFTQFSMANLYSDALMKAICIRITVLLIRIKSKDFFVGNEFSEIDKL